MAISEKWPYGTGQQHNFGYISGSQMETANDQAKKKPPSRKQRRKPSCMRSVYRRRQQDNVWLETHIWHAKRMKMVGKYGYHLAEHCSDKGVRAAHRSLVNGCLMSVSECQ